MPDLLPRVKDLGIIVVQNPTHFALRDLPIKRFGSDRTEHSSRFARCLITGIPVALGSDGQLRLLGGNRGPNCRLADDRASGPAMGSQHAVAATAFDTPEVEGVSTSERLIVRFQITRI